MYPALQAFRAVGRRALGRCASSRAFLRGLLLLPLLPLLAGCNLTVMFPAGDVAVQQRNLVLASTGLMLLIILPVIALTLLFAWRYRASNTQARHDPDWDHSTGLEVVIWTAPLMIIIALGALTWISTHTLDPFRPLSRLEPGKPVPAQTKPLEVQVVALDWKWLFFLPEYGVASVNELAAPVNRPIAFKLTSASVMNSFYIPALAGMIYAMPGMETKLHAVINKPGAYQGLASHYSGSGFSRMTFKFHGLDGDGFDQWVAKLKSEGKELSREAYLELERPSENVPVIHYASYADGLFGSILGMCAVPGKMCMHEMMAIDAKGGAGKDSRENAARLQYDNRHTERGDEAPGATGPASHHAPRSDKPADSQDHGPHGKGQNSPAPNQLNN
ncbi:ubiquinol oxidase subunit II [Methylorubrum rhodinum]|nr:ubiquinol oxidase subunit II [Methylorubrum rhodinum]